MAELWCFNCEQRVREEEVFNATRHKGFLGKQMAVVQSIRAANEEIIVCICQDCVFYKIQICSCCSKAAPLCMFTLEEWFVANALQRKCLDCTALDETLHVCSSLPYQIPTNQFVQQCLKCSKFKYICSFVLFRHGYNENCCHRAIRDGHERPCRKSNSRSDENDKYSVCIECKLLIDIQAYKLFLKERYHFRISLEPSLSCNTDASAASKNMKTYANAVIDGLVSKVLQSKQECVDQGNGKPFNGPVFVISTLKDYICNPVTMSLRKSLKYLKEKIKLELRLCDMNMGLWQSILKCNVQATTHAFSCQGTETTDFSQAETRWAYTAVYMPVHASIVYDAIASFSHDNVPLLMSTQPSDKGIEVCCFGAGVGSEVVGLNYFLPKGTVFHLFDNCPSWEHNAKEVLGGEFDISFTFNAFDVTKKMHSSVLRKVKRATIFTFVKFLSAVRNLSDAVPSLRSILEAAPEGSSFLFIDNSLISIRNYVESLIFPERNYRETKHGKENDEYIIYTSYAEFRFEIEDALERRAVICDYVNLMAEWLDRPPLSDLRVYLFHVIKK